MSRSSPPLVLAAISIGVSLSAGTAAERLNIGRSVSPEDLAAWDIDVRADGTGLPAGRGSVKQGRRFTPATALFVMATRVKVAALRARSAALIGWSAGSGR